MSNYGFHWTPCRGGGDATVILAGAGLLACAFAVEWVASHAWEILAVTAACGALAVSAVVALMRWTDRRAAAFGAALAARRERTALTVTAAPQVTAPSVQVVEHRHYIYPVTAPDPASAIVRAAITGTPGVTTPQTRRRDYDQGTHHGRHG